MSTLSSGFPDWQRITQWFGPPLDQATAFAIGAGQLVVGPLNVRNFASIVVCVKPTGGTITCTVAQAVPGGPAGLVSSQTFVCAAGNVIFEAFVLLAGVVTVTFQGSAGGETFDYAIVPSNTNTNAEVAALTQLGFQHNDAVVANETAIDFVDAAGAAWVMVDDPANLRMKVSLPAMYAPLSHTVVGAPVASVDIQSISQLFRHLQVVVYGRSTAAVVTTFVFVRLNNDATANYHWSRIVADGAVVTSDNGAGDTGMRAGIVSGASSTAGFAGANLIDIPAYTGAVFHKEVISNAGDASGLQRVGQGHWNNAAAITRITVSLGSGNFDTGSVVTLYGRP